MVFYGIQICIYIYIIIYSIIHKMEYGIYNYMLWDSGIAVIWWEYHGAIMGT